MKANRPTKAQREVEEKITTGKWWPFDRADAVLLERIHRKANKKQVHQLEKEQALL